MSSLRNDVREALQNAYDNGYIGFLRDSTSREIVDDLIRLDATFETTPQSSHARMVEYTTEWKKEQGW